MYIDTGADGPGGPARMIVAPDRILQLRKGLEEERELLRLWLRREALELTEIKPPGSDPCSRDTMDTMSKKGRDAVRATEAYVHRLTTIINNLHDSAVAYGMIEDDNSNAYLRVSE